MLDLPFTLMVWLFMPTYEMVMGLPVDLSVKLPSKSVMPPFLVPCSIMLAPMTASPLESFTLTLTVCACIVPTNMRRARTSVALILFNFSDIKFSSFN